MKEAKRRYWLHIKLLSVPSVPVPVPSELMAEQMSKVEWQKSNVKSQMAKVKWQKSNGKSQMSKVKWQMSNVKSQKSNKFQKSNV